MGIYDRDYYRREGPSFLASLGDGGKVCMWLIAINVGIYILQLVTRGTVSYDDLGYPSPGSSPITDWLILDTSKVLHGQVWRLLTGAFLHDPNSLTHIFFNMLFLWWFGHEVENIYGGKEFLAFYLAAAIIGNVAYVAWQLVTGDRTQALGASGAVSAAMVLFAMHYPHYRILLFWFVPVSIWLFVVFEVGKDLYVFLTDSNPMVAVTAHLGGAAFGFLYYRQQWRVLDWVPDFSGARRMRARPKLRVYRGDDAAPEPMPAVAPAAVEPSVDEHLEAQLDAVLAKMNRSGKESLTESEREILLRAAEVYKRRRP
jgi:membrane associated rhomboid family serine protease